MDLNAVRETIRRIDDDLVRAQYSLAIYKAARQVDGSVKPEIIKALSSRHSMVSFNHIDLIVQQDCALALCRMMDKGKDTHSFWWLKNLCSSNRQVLLDNAAAQYLDPDHKTLRDMLVDDTKIWTNEFISKVSSLNKSKGFKAVKNLRDDTLGHALKDVRSLRPSIKMVENCLSELEVILGLSYLLFLCTDYRPQRAFEFAMKDAECFWGDFSKR